MTSLKGGEVEVAAWGGDGGRKGVRGVVAGLNLCGVYVWHRGPASGGTAAGRGRCGRLECAGLKDGEVQVAACGRDEAAW
jgi:hypothetical protein